MKGRRPRRAEFEFSAAARKKREERAAERARIPDEPVPYRGNVWRGRAALDRAGAWRRKWHDNFPTCWLRILWRGAMDEAQAAGPYPIP